MAYDLYKGIVNYMLGLKACFFFMLDLVTNCQLLASARMLLTSLARNRSAAADLAAKASSFSSSLGELSYSSSSRTQPCTAYKNSLKLIWPAHIISHVVVQPTQCCTTNSKRLKSQYNTSSARKASPTWHCAYWQRRSSMWWLRCDTHVSRHILCLHQDRSCLQFTPVAKCK